MAIEKSTSNPAAFALSVFKILSDKPGQGSPAGMMANNAQAALEMVIGTSTVLARRHIEGGRGELGQAWSDIADWASGMKRDLAENLANGLSPGEATSRVLVELQALAAM